MSSEPIRVLADSAALAHAAAEEFVLRASSAISINGRFAAALSGGNTPRDTYALLAAPEFRDRVDWSCVKLFQVDERLVHYTDPASNYRMIDTALASRVPLPPGAFERFRSEGEDPEAIAKHGEQQLRDWFRLGEGQLPRFDLILLGLGADGHTASLFPGLTALAETRRLVVPVQVAARESRRVTLTLPVINNASGVVFLVSGAEKAKTLRAVLRPEPGTAPLPAALVRPAAGPPLWLVDAAAASAL